MRLYSYDTETFRILDGLVAPPVVVASVAQPRPRTERLLLASRARTWFRNALKKPDLHIVGANIPFDLGVMCADDPGLVDLVFEVLEAGRLHDVSIRESLLDIARGQLGIDPRTGRKLDDEDGVKYALDVLVMRYYARDISAGKKGPDVWRLRYGELYGVPLWQWPKEARYYPKSDARETVDVFQAQEKAAESIVNRGNLHHEKKALQDAWSLHLISCWGLRTNEKRVAALDASVEATHQANLIEFKKAGIVREDGTEDKKKQQELVFEAYAGNPPRTGKGAIATDRDTKIQSGSKILKAHGSSGRNNKYKTTYLPKLWKGVHVPINPRFYGMAATTRVTSDYQQLPQKGGIRDCHEPRPGCVYCSVDYTGLELRTMSQRCIWERRVGYSKMAKVLLSGKPLNDVHCTAAAQMMGISYEECYRRVKAKDPIAIAFRALAKIFNFGKGGGMGPKALAYNARAKDGVLFCQLAKALPEGKCGSEGFDEVMIRGDEKRVCAACVAVATKLDGGWLEAWTEQADLFAIASHLHRKGARSEVVIPVANVVRGNCTYTQWLNTPFQGLGAVLTTRAMNRISREMYTNRKSPLWGSRLVLNVHDELIAELLIAHAHEAAERMALIMREEAQACMPDLAPSVEAEPALALHLYKEMWTEKNEDGKLVPVERCSDCGNLTAVEWDGTRRKHFSNPKTEILCAGIGRPEPEATRLLTLTAA